MLMMSDIDLGLKRTATIPLVIMEKLLMVIGYVDIFPKPYNLPPITQFTMVYCCISLLLLVVFMKFFMKSKEVIVLANMEDMY